MICSFSQTVNLGRAIVCLSLLKCIFVPISSCTSTRKINKKFVTFNHGHNYAKQLYLSNVITLFGRWCSKYLSYIQWKSIKDCIKIFFNVNVIKIGQL